MITLKGSRFPISICVLAFVAFGLLIPRVALAVPPPDLLQRFEAKKHFDLALELADKRAYAEAIVEFNRAYEISPHYTVLYNVGQAYIGLSNPVKAIETLQRYLKEGGAQVPNVRMVQVDQEIRKQEALVATLTIQTNIPGAFLRIDGADIGRTPLAAPVRVGMGAHRVAAVLDGYRAVEQSVALVGGEKRAVSLNLEKTQPVVMAAAPGVVVRAPALAPPPATPAPVRLPAPVPPPAPLVQAQPTVPPSAPDDRGHHRRVAAYVVGALGLVAGGATVAHFVWNKGRFDDWQTEDRSLTAERMVLPVSTSLDRRQLDNNARAEQIRSASKVTVGLGIGAGALLATGIILWATSPREGGAPSVAPAATHAFGVGPNSVTWQVTFP